MGEASRHRRHDGHLSRSCVSPSIGLASAGRQPAATYGCRKFPTAGRARSSQRSAVLRSCSQNTHTPRPPKSRSSTSPQENTVC
eukprot:COSAG01_NODE_955_length_12483_cov_19.703731_1_plen_84_part_00